MGIYRTTKNRYIKVTYDIVAYYDMDGDFPLRCAAMLFDLLGFRENVIVRNKYVVRKERDDVIQHYMAEKRNLFFERPGHADSDYCVWIKERLASNLELMELLNLQAIDLHYIVPTASFNEADIEELWTTDIPTLLQTGKASFVCNIVDQDRELELFFDPDVIPESSRTNALTAWEQQIVNYVQPVKLRRKEIGGPHGEKYFVQLEILEDTGRKRGFFWKK